MLPKEFTERMEQMLGEDFPAFLASFEEPRYQALRINRMKADEEEFLAKAPFSLKPVPWAAGGYYYDAGDTPGKHPYHEAGVYYIQEPSAMAPAEYLLQEENGRQPEEAAMEHERILDLCAAPGGKSTQIAAIMQGRGILVSNEIHPARAKILSENMERMGVRNAMVTNETPAKLAEIFDGYFTRILVDAPCSGEGMFRKNEEACKEWSPENVSLCAERQDEILDCAASMLMSGGRLVYSTCTFAPEENEGSISRFVKRHPEFSVEKVKKSEGMLGGVPYYVKDPAAGIEDTIRLWPHKLQGEGHYLAVLKKEGSANITGMGFGLKFGVEKGIPAKDLSQPQKGSLEFLEFAEEALKKDVLETEQIKGTYLRFGDQLYLAPSGMPSVQGLKVLRPGLHLGTVKKNRFEPSHALALTLKPKQVCHTINLSGDDSEINAYLNGQTFSCQGEKGWYLITADGYSIGWGKLAGGVMKNHYPKGLRRNY